MKEAYKRGSEDTVKEISEMMLESVRSQSSRFGGYPYKNSQTQAIVIEGNMVRGGIEDYSPEAYFHEYGTGVVGSRNPTISEQAQALGWQYDYNSHGESGWWYPTTEDDPNPYKWTGEDGQLYGWTKGLAAMNAYTKELEKYR